MFIEKIIFNDSITNIYKPLLQKYLKTSLSFSFSYLSLNQKIPSTVSYSSKINHTMKNFLIMTRSILGETQKYLTQFQIIFLLLGLIPHFPCLSLFPTFFIFSFLDVYVSHLALPTCGSALL